MNTELVSQVSLVMVALMWSYFVLSFFLLFRQKDSLTVQNRGWQNSVISCLCLGCCATMFSLSFGFGVPCYVRAVTEVAVIQFGLWVLLERMFLIYVHFVVQVEAKKFLEEKTKDKRKDWAHYFFEHRAFLKMGWITPLRLASFIVSSSITIPYAIAAYFDPFASEEGMRCQGFVYTAYLMLSVLAFFALAIKLAMAMRQVQENFGIKKEIAHLCYAALVAGPFAALTVVLAFLPESNSAFTGLALAHQVGQCFVFPAVMFSIMFLEAVFFSKLRHARAKKRGTSSFTSGNPGSPKREPKNKLEATIRDPVLYEAFYAYLCREFCAENILFLRAVYEYEDAFDTGAKDAIKLGHAIHSNFLDSSSLIEVNISYQVRSKLKAALDRGNYSRDTFEPAVEEVSRMLIDGPFIRFRRGRKELQDV
jgi:hypothetical protein